MGRCEEDTRKAIFCVGPGACSVHNADNGFQCADLFTSYVTPGGVACVRSTLGQARSGAETGIGEHNASLDAAT
jgi:hypothetical protein